MNSSMFKLTSTWLDLKHTWLLGRISWRTWTTCLHPLSRSKTCGWRHAPRPTTNKRNQCCCTIATNWMGVKIHAIECYWTHTHGHSVVLRSLWLHAVVEDLICICFGIRGPAVFVRTQCQRSRFLPNHAARTKHGNGTGRVESGGKD